MARLIYQQDSTTMHRRMARRHIRLCGQINGAARFGQAMQPKLTTLAEREQERKIAEEQCEDALDNLTLKDVMLDSAVHNLYDYARIYDRDHLTQFTAVLFPSFRYTDIINLPVAEEPVEAVRLIEKLQSLKDAEFAGTFVNTLNTAMNDVNEALGMRLRAVENLRRQQGQEELARNDVRTQYEINYLDARKDFGKQKAELLFPKIAHRPGKSAKSEADSSMDE